MAKNKMPKGKTPKFPITSHIKINPTNQAKMVVWIRLNLREIIKILTAKQRDHIPQIAPFIGSEGKIRPNF
jgi:hypothetical protein